MEEDVDPLIAQTFSNTRRHARSSVALMHHIDVGSGNLRLAARFANQGHQPLNPHREAASRRRLPAELLDEAIITTTRTHCTLRTKTIRHPFENGQVVVVEATHETRVDLERQTSIAQHLLHAIKMRHRLGAQMIHQLRGAGDHFLHRRILAVENAQRIGVKAPPRIFVEQVAVFLEIGDEFGAVLPNTSAEQASLALHRIQERLNEVVDGWAKGRMVWLCIPLTLLITWMYTSLDQVGESTENPFEGGANDVPISRICEEVEVDLREMLGETGLPPPLRAVGNIAV